MNKEFIPYEQALALKELGFAEPCFARYADMTLPKKTGSFLSRTDWDTMHVNFIESQSVSAPLYQQAFRWFRDKYNRLHTVNIDLSNNLKDKVFVYTIEDHLGSIVGRSEEYTTYEEAESACLDKLIEICKTKINE
jgi:hypothetical protein